MSPSPDLALTPDLKVPDVASVELLFLGLAMLVAIGALSRQHGRPFSASLVYLAVGLAAAVLVGVFKLPWIDPFENAAVMERMSELALIVALFATGLKIERKPSLRGWRAVALLLGVLMPLTIAAVAAYGLLAMGLSVGAAIALGAILAPTDPVLVGDVGEGPPGEPERGDARFNLTAEAGLNDGLASPFVLLGAFVVQRDGLTWLSDWLLADVAYAIGVGAVLGAGGGYALAALADWMRQRDLLSSDLDGFLVIGAVLAVYGASNAIDAYGLISVFVAGIAFRRYEFVHEYNRRAHDGAEIASKFTELAVILLLGSVTTTALVMEPGLGGLLLPLVLYVALRPSATVLLLAGTTMGVRERAFVGWLGVKGIASVYYVSYLLHEKTLSPSEAVTVFWTVAFAVIASIALHGATQSYVTRRLLPG
jgi:sodium/hydrogen antiporter